MSTHDTEWVAVICRTCDGGGQLASRSGYQTSDCEDCGGTGFVEWDADTLTPAELISAAVIS